MGAVAVNSRAAVVAVSTNMVTVASTAAVVAVTMVAAVVATMAVAAEMVAVVVALAAEAAVAAATATAATVAAVAAATVAPTAATSRLSNFPLLVKIFENWHYCHTHDSDVDSNSTSTTCVCPGETPPAQGDAHQYHGGQHAKHAQNRPLQYRWKAINTIPSPAPAIFVFRKVIITSSHMCIDRNKKVIPKGREFPMNRPWERREGEHDSPKRREGISSRREIPREWGSRKKRTEKGNAQPSGQSWRRNYQ